MPPVAVETKVTDAFRAKLAAIYAGTATWAGIKCFQIGEGGWTGSPQVPISPDGTEVALSAPLYPVGSKYIFTKLLVPADLTFVGPRTAKILCYVDLAEANDDGFGAAPEFFELGIFDIDMTGLTTVPAPGVMVVYQTFPMEVKTLVKTLEHYILVDF